MLVYQDILKEFSADYNKGYKHFKARDGARTPTLLGSEAIITQFKRSIRLGAALAGILVSNRDTSHTKVNWRSY